MPEVVTYRRLRYRGMSSNRGLRGASGATGSRPTRPCPHHRRDAGVIRLLWHRLRHQRRSADLDAPTKDRIWAVVQERIELEPAPRPELASLAWQRSAIGAFSAALILVMVVVAALHQHPESNQVLTGLPLEGDASPSTLTELADVARAQPDAVLDAEHPYLHTITDYIPDANQRANGVEGWRDEQWLAADGSGRIRILALPNRPGRVQETDQERGAGKLKVQRFLPSEIMRLPADPDDLLVELQARTGEVPRPEQIASLMALPLPARLRGALIESLAVLGIHPTAQQTDPHSVSFQTVAGEPTVEIDFDAETARPTAMRVHGTQTSDDDPVTMSFRVAEVATSAG